MKTIKLLIIFSIFILASINGYAQNNPWDAPLGGAGRTEDPSYREFRRGLATIIYSSLGGAVLGLSTLPFYTKPEEHTGNITSGALAGLLAGTAYLIFNNDSKNQNKVLPYFSVDSGLPIFAVKINF